MIHYYIAASTSLLLGQQRPGQYNSSLYDARVKHGVIQDVKTKVHPAGDMVAVRWS